MFQNKTMNLIISLLLSVALWIYVVGEVNPETTKKYDDIKIDFTNEESLAQNGLALLFRKHMHCRVRIAFFEQFRERRHQHHVADLAQLADENLARNKGVQVHHRIPASSAMRRQLPARFKV